MRLTALACSISIFPLSAAANTDYTIQIKQRVKEQNPHIAGWCSPKKSDAMMDLIFETKPNVCVELGVLAGASLLPTAMALKHLNHGVVYGIDAWDSQEVVKHYEPGNPHRLWWEQQDMGLHKRSCENLIQSNQLESHAVLLKDTFANAVSQIGAIDILHIHATLTDDARAYCDKVKLGGYIWFDGWANSPTLYEYLQKDFEITKVINSGQCILLKRISGDIK
jgi:hypothetical protein